MRYRITGEHSLQSENIKEEWENKQEKPVCTLRGDDCNAVDSDRAVQWTVGEYVPICYF